MRLPSFNDFSPVIIGDIRRCLQVIKNLNGDDHAIINDWAKLFFAGKTNKRSSTNIPATLTSTGLISSGRPFTLTAFGEKVLAQPSAKEAAQQFCAGILMNENGFKLLEAIRSLNSRGDKVTKESLKKALGTLGIEKLSTNTTDHTTLMNWMGEAGILVGKPPNVDDDLLKSLTGISALEHDEFSKLSLGQQAFLELLRKQHLTGPGPFAVQPLFGVCRQKYPHLFSESQFAKEIRIPLVNGGWMQVTGLASGTQGGKSGNVTGTAKLKSIPIERLAPGFDQVVPADLRAKLDTPLVDIKTDLFGANKHKAGLALELLALRMIIDLDLLPRGFRVRAPESAYAEVDLTAEGVHLLFSRWTFQCKRTSSKVGLSEVAKEVGIALFVRAHVVAMVSTSDFSKDAYAYAREITKATHLQFVFLPGKTIREYLSIGRDALLKYVLANAKHVMQEKAVQQSALAKVDET